MVSIITTWGVRWICPPPHTTITQEQSNKRGRRGGCQWVLWLSGRALAAYKPEALGSVQGGTPFLSFPLLSQRSTDSNGTSLSLIRRSLSVFGLWGSTVHRTPHAVITLTIHYDQHKIFQCPPWNQNQKLHAFIYASLIWSSFLVLFLARCTGGCHHDGVCIDPELCECPSNWHGRYCEKGEFCCMKKYTVYMCNI